MRLVRPVASFALALVVLVLGSAPATIQATSGLKASVDPARRIALVRSRIKYVFIIYQENRSFDSYFGTFPGAEGLYAHPPSQQAGFTQPIENVDGSMGTVQPFRIGPEQFAADTDDVDHSHSATVAKMDVSDGVPQMDHFALTEEKKYGASGLPSLVAKQMGELTMAHEDCDTVPFLWTYAKKFALYDHIFEAMSGPSTPGNLTIIAAQTGVTQWLLHPEDASSAGGLDGVPVLSDPDPFWGSPMDHQSSPPPVNPSDFPRDSIERNLTFASLPLTLQGATLPDVVKSDRDPDGDLADVGDDVTAIAAKNGSTVDWGWYQEGYDAPQSGGADPIDAEGRHASYVTHHNGPQYFGYVADNDRMRKHLHGLGDLFQALAAGSLPSAGGVFYVKGGMANIAGLTPADPDAAVQSDFRGDDDHPGYSDSQISEAMVARAVNAIATSPYWDESAIIITWDDAEGDYDHVPPPLRYALPGDPWVSDGPRVPLILISPYAKTGAIVSDTGDQASVVKFVDEAFGLIPLAQLPDEAKASAIGRQKYGSGALGPGDDPSNGLTDLLNGFDDERLAGQTPPLPPSYAEIPSNVIDVLPQRSGYGCAAIGIVPTDVQMGIANPIPADFNPRPKTDPTLIK